jgi:hypothetical protein
MLPSANMFLLSLFATAALTSVLPPRIGTTVTEESNPGRLSFKQVRNNKHVAYGPLSVYKTYLKFKAPIPDYLHEAVRNFTISKRATGSATATPIDTYEYVLSY